MKTKLTLCAIDEKQHREIKIRAAKEGVTFKVILGNLLEKALKGSNHDRNNPTIK